MFNHLHWEQCGHHHLFLVYYKSLPTCLCLYLLPSRYIKAFLKIHIIFETVLDFMEKLRVVQSSQVPFI